jgi:hypothetical protein
VSQHGVHSDDYTVKNTSQDLREVIRNKFNFQPRFKNTFHCTGNKHNFLLKSSRTPQLSRSFPVDAAVLYGGEVLPGTAIKETTHTCDIAMD